MFKHLSPQDIRRRRLQSQLLADSTPAKSAAHVVRHLIAMQAQEWESAQFAIAARSRYLNAAEIQRERETERSFVLTWTLRGTLHLVAAEDLGWMLQLCGERAIRSTRRRYEQLGLSEAIRERALDDIADILTNQNALTRPRLADKLCKRGIPVEGQAIHHLVRFAALRGLICCGPVIDGAMSFVLLRDWLPKRAEAANVDPLPQLARRYLQAYGPASPADFARWTGLSASNAKRAFAAIDALPFSADLYALAEQADAVYEPSAIEVRYLPRYDNYALAYATRNFMVAADYAKRIHPGGGLIRAFVVNDGQACANWTLDKARGQIRATPFAELNDSWRPALENEKERLADFLGRDLELMIEDA